MNKESETNIQKEKIPYRGFDFKERLLPTLLLAFAIPFTVVFFGAFEIFGNNLGEFGFALGDFIGFNILITLLVMGVITAILLPLKGRVFDIVYAVFFWLAVMLFVQGNYLSMGMNSLEGDGVGNSKLTDTQISANALVWVIILAWVIFAVFAIKKRDILKIIMTVGMVTLIAMQLVSFVTVSLTTDVYKSVEERKAIAIGSEDLLPEDDNAAFLTYENLDVLSKNKNVVVFIVDRFDNDYIATINEKKPELLNEMDGFTLFNDTVSLYPRTYPAVTHLITGVENDFESSRLAYLKKAYVESDFLKVLDENGYNVNIYTDGYYGYDNAIYIPADNVSGSDGGRVDDKLGLSFDMIRLSLYRYLPLFARDAVGNISTPDFEKYVIYSDDAPKYTTDMKDVYEYVSGRDFVTDAEGNNFSFVHITGCHLPNKYDADFNPVSEDDEWDIEIALEQSFKIINRYLSEMKRLGVYDDATIVITGDHTNIKSDSKDPYEPHVTALYVKRAGENFDGIKVSNAQISHEDILATIIDSENIESDVDFGTSAFDVSEGQERTRRYIFQRYKSETKTYEIVEYEIKGSSHDFEGSWKIVNRYDLGKSIYD